MTIMITNSIHAIAEACPNSKYLKPALYIMNTGVVEANSGPPDPLVKIKGVENICKALIKPIVSVKKRVGVIIGTVMWMNCCTAFAPSKEAAS